MSRASRPTRLPPPRREEALTVDGQAFGGRLNAVVATGSGRGGAAGLRLGAGMGRRCAAVGHNSRIIGACRLQSAGSGQLPRLSWRRPRGHGHLPHQACATERSARPLRSWRTAVRGLSRAGRRARGGGRRPAGGHASISVPRRRRRRSGRTPHCLSCHQSNAAHDWASSAHAASDVACASCHQLHVAKDPVQTRGRPRSRSAPAVTKPQHADLDKLSHHPLREGKMACTVLPFAAWLDGARAAREEHGQ